MGGGGGGDLMWSLSVHALQLCPCGVQALLTQMYGTSYVGERLTRRLRSDVFDAVMRQEVRTRWDFHSLDVASILLLCFPVRVLLRGSMW